MHRKFSSYFVEVLGKNPELLPLAAMYNYDILQDLDKIKEFTFLIPTKAMIKQMVELSHSKDTRDLKRMLYSLCIPKKLSKPTDWRGSLPSIREQKLIVRGMSSKNVMFGDDVTASFTKATQNAAFWNLHGAHMPAINPKKGGFDNSTSELKDTEPTPSLQLLAEKILKSIKTNGFEALVLTMYESLTDDDKKKANCIIKGNPAMEFFILYDSPFFTCDKESLLEMAPSDKDVKEWYKQICNTPCDVCSAEEIKELKARLLDAHSGFDNEIKKFYNEIHDGKYTFEGKTYHVCHPAFSKHLYTMDVFDYISSSMVKNITDHNELVKNLIFLNNSTNVKSIDLYPFTEKDEIRGADIALERFKRYGLCSVCKVVAHTGGAERKNFKLKSRKLLKFRSKIKDLKPAEKQKIRKILTEG